MSQSLEEVGAKISFIVNNVGEEVKSFPDLSIEFFNWIEDRETLFDKIQDVDILLIDSLLINRSFYIEIESIISNLIFIDDYYKWQHKKGLIIDWSVLADKNRISDIVQSGQYLLGVEYTALRKEFWETPKKIVAENINNILLTFGGSDVRNSSIRMLRLLNDAYSHLRITVVVGESYDDVEEIRREAKGNVTLVYSPDARRMKESMLNTDVAIASGGQTLYELARTGVPTIAIIAADNQLGDVYGWESVGFLLNAGWWNHSNLEENVITFIEKCFCKKRRQEMADIGQSLVDGQGARKIAQSIVETYK